MYYPSFRYAKANHPGIQEYDISKEKEHLIYLDANNLYGWAMGQSLPTKNFRWLTEEEKFNINFMEIGENSDIGYILEVDLGTYFTY